LTRKQETETEIQANGENLLKLTGDKKKDAEIERKPGQLLN
jgi:hypothetical protein